MRYTCPIFTPRDTRHTSTIVQYASTNPSNHPHHITPRSPRRASPRGGRPHNSTDRSTTERWWLSRRKDSRSRARRARRSRREVRLLCEILARSFVPRRSIDDRDSTTRWWTRRVSVGSTSPARAIRDRDTRSSDDRGARDRRWRARANGVSSIPRGETGGRITWMDLVTASDIARDDDDDDARRRRRWMDGCPPRSERSARFGLIGDRVCGGGGEGS
jgi:hypothetical protein